MDPISGGNANAYVYSVDPINSQDVSGRFSISWSSVVNAVEHVVNTVSNALTVLHTWEDVHPRLTFVISVLATGSSGGASEDEGIDLQGSRDFVGRRGSPLVPHDQVDSLGNRPTVIEDRLYKGHALNEMQNGGIYPTVVENTIQNGYEVPSSQAETTRLYDPANGVTAVLNSGGDVITTFYGERMQ